MFHGCLVFVALAASFPLSIGYVAYGLVRAVLLSAGIGRASLSWPSVPGVIESIEVVEFRGLDSDPVTRSPRVVYSYSVQGRPYKGHAVSAAGSTGSDIKSIEGLVVGESVRVHYDPRNPEMAVLVRGRKVWEVAAMIFAILSVCVPLTAGALMVEWELLKSHPQLVFRHIGLIALPFVRPTPQR